MLSVNNVVDLGWDGVRFRQAVSATIDDLFCELKKRASTAIAFVPTESKAVKQPQTRQPQTKQTRAREHTSSQKQRWPEEARAALNSKMDEDRKLLQQIEDMVNAIETGNLDRYMDLDVVIAVLVSLSNCSTAPTKEAACVIPEAYRSALQGFMLSADITSRLPSNMLALRHIAAFAKDTTFVYSDAKSESGSQTFDPCTMLPVNTTISWDAKKMHKLRADWAYRESRFWGQFVERMSPILVLSVLHRKGVVMSAKDEDFADCPVPSNGTVDECLAILGIGDVRSRPKDISAKLNRVDWAFRENRPSAGFYKCKVQFVPVLSECVVVNKGWAILHPSQMAGVWQRYLQLKIEDHLTRIPSQFSPWPEKSFFRASEALVPLESDQRRFLFDDANVGQLHHLLEIALVQDTLFSGLKGFAGSSSSGQYVTEGLTIAHLMQFKQAKLLPPCQQIAIVLQQNSRSIGHKNRFHFISFLKAIGIGMRDAANYMRLRYTGSEDIAATVRYIYNDGKLPGNCTTLAVDGMCPFAKDTFSFGKAIQDIEEIDKALTEVKLGTEESPVIQCRRYMAARLQSERAVQLEIDESDKTEDDVKEYADLQRLFVDQLAAREIPTEGIAIIGKKGRLSYNSAQGCFYQVASRTEIGQNASAFKRKLE